MAPCGDEAERGMTATPAAKENVQKHGSRHTGSVCLSMPGKARGARNPAGGARFREGISDTF